VSNSFNIVVDTGEQELHACGDLGLQAAYLDAHYALSPQVDEVLEGQLLALGLQLLLHYHSVDHLLVVRSKLSDYIVVHIDEFDRR
jgi:hypothetical protein